MGVPYYGDFAEDDTVNIPFNTFSSDDPSKSCTITELADADIKVYKDGSTDEIVTDGASVVINFDGHTGAHLITIDTSADAAYSTGSEYAVLIDGTVIDSATDMDMWIGTFSIERAGGALARLETLITTVGAAGVGLTDVNTKTITAGAVANASFNADVGSTAHGTNIIALACRKILEELNLDHLLKVDTTVAADGDLEDYCVAGTVMGHLLSTSADATLYKASTDSMQAIRDHIGDGTNLTEVTVAALDANVITAASINADAITEAKIADNALANEHFAAGALTATEITGAAGCAVSSIGNDVITPASVDEDADFVIQALSITNALDAGSVLVDGTTTLTGNVSCGAGFDVVGALSANSLLIDTTTALTGTVSTGAITAASASITGQLDAGNLLVDGTTVLTGTVGTGAVTLASLSCTGQLDAGSVVVDAGMDIVGALSANSLLIDTTTTLTGNVALSGTLAVAGTTTLTGAVSAPAGITADITGALSGAVGSVTGHTAQTGDSFAIVNGDHGLVSIQDDVDEILTDTGSTLDTLIKDIPTNTEAATIVNAQVLDVLNVDTFAEPGDEAPTSTTTLVDKIGYLYKFLRNQVWTTATKINVYNDAADNVDHTATISDDATTFKRGEFGAGE